MGITVSNRSSPEVKNSSLVIEDDNATSRIHEFLRAYCHQTRNILNSMNMIMYLAERSGELGRNVDLPALGLHYHDLERYIDRLHCLCRPMSLNLVRLSIGLLFEQHASAWSRTLEAAGRRLLLKGKSEPAVGNFDPCPLGTALTDLVNWRAHTGPVDTDLRVCWSAAKDRFSIEWDEPKHRRRPPRSISDESSRDDPLAIPFLCHVIQSHHGALTTSNNPRWRAHLSWPLNVQSERRDISK